MNFRNWFGKSQGSKNQEFPGDPPKVCFKLQGSKNGASIVSASFSFRAVEDFVLINNFGSLYYLDRLNIDVLYLCLDGLLESRIHKKRMCITGIVKSQ